MARMTGSLAGKSQRADLWRGHRHRLRLRRGLGAGRGAGFPIGPPGGSVARGGGQKPAGRGSAMPPGDATPGSRCRAGDRGGRRRPWAASTPSSSQPASAGNASIEDETLAEFQRISLRNLLPHFLASRAAIPHLRASGGGAIIPIASVLGLVGTRRRLAYCTAKAGVIGMVRAMALDLAEQKIQVNAICPGFVETDMTEAVIAQEGRSRRSARRSANAAARWAAPASRGRSARWRSISPRTAPPGPRDRPSPWTAASPRSRVPSGGDGGLDIPKPSGIDALLHGAHRLETRPVDHLPEKSRCDHSRVKARRVISGGTSRVLAAKARKSSHSTPARLRRGEIAAPDPRRRD